MGAVGGIRRPEADADCFALPGPDTNIPNALGDLPAIAAAIAAGDAFSNESVGARLRDVIGSPKNQNKGMRYVKKELNENDNPSRCNFRRN